MNDSLPQLEAQKSDLLRQLATVGDLRRGSITATSGKCGKPNCHCAKRGDVGHGPNFRLTRRVAGKTTTETVASPAALRKVGPRPLLQGVLLWIVVAVASLLAIRAGWIGI